MSESKKPLYIPVNTPDYDAIISGIGSVELSIFAVVLAITITVGLLLTAIVSTMVTVWSGVLFMSVVIITVRRDPYNENFYKKTKLLWEFQKRQKKYIYQYHNIYEE